MNFEGYRIEIAFHTLPQHWNRNYPEQLASVIEVLLHQRVTDKHLTLNFNNKHKTYLKLSLIDERPYFECLINLSNKPPLQKPSIVIGEISNLQTSITQAINDALTQLPSNNNLIIFLYSLSEVNVNESIIKFFQNRKISNLKGIYSWAGNLKFYINPAYVLKIHDVNKI